MSENDQFETIASIRAYCKRILRLTKKDDHRPSTAKIIMRDISAMHNLKDRLEIS